MAKRDFSVALRKTATAQKDIIDDRFSRADSVLLGLKGKPEDSGKSPLPQDEEAPATLPSEATAPTEAGATRAEASVIRDTFSMPPGDHGLIETLRTRAAREGRNTSKSEVIRAGLVSLASLGSAQLIALLDGLVRIKPGRK